MSKTTSRAACAAALALMGAGAPARAADVYVRATIARAPIREAADAKSPVVGYARKGDVFKLAQEQEGWVGVVLFSGDVRFLPAAQAKKTSYSPATPPELFLRRELFRAFAKADDRAKRESEKKFAADFAAQAKSQRLLEDRYKLDTVQRYRIQAPVYGLIQKEGADSGWR
jgi:hypothetical protein